MLFHASSLAVAALAGVTLAAEPALPYRPTMLRTARMSAGEIFGLDARQGLSAYDPSLGYRTCGTGTTCAESCGSGYAQCSSSDSNAAVLHCYEPAAGQVCCPDATGNSCDAGYYCAQDGARNTWCCPDGLSVGDCASKFDVTGDALTSEPPRPMTTTEAAPTASLSTRTRLVTHTYVHSILVPANVSSTSTSTSANATVVVTSQVVATVAATTTAPATVLVAVTPTLYSSAWSTMLPASNQTFIQPVTAGAGRGSVEGRGVVAVLAVLVAAALF